MDIRKLTRRNLKGGTRSHETLGIEQDADLDMAEYPTVSLLMDGTEQALYEMTGANLPFFFGGGFIDWTGLNAGGGEDTEIKVYIKVDGTNYRLIYNETFLAVAVPSPPAVPFPRGINTQPVPDQWYSKQDIRVTAQQAAIGGGWNTLLYSIIDAKNSL